MPQHRKAITPVVAIVLILLITVAAAGLSFMFIRTSQSELQESTQSDITQLQRETSTCMSADNIAGSTAYLRNCGQGIINKTSLTVFIDGQPVDYELSDNIDPDQVMPLYFEGHYIGDHELRIVADSGAQLRKEFDGGTALRFNSGTYLNAPMSLAGAREYTISAWVKWTSASASSNNLGNSPVESVSPRYDYAIYAQTGRISIYAHPGNPSDIGSAGFSTDTSVWHHVVAWRDDGQVRIYVDGMRRATDSVTNNPVDSTSINFGKNPSFSGDRFIGIVDEVRVYGRPLSDQEIKDDMYGSYPTNDLISYWSFDNIKGCNVPDDVGSSPGTLEPSCPSNAPAPTSD